MSTVVLSLTTFAQVSVQPTQREFTVPQPATHVSKIQRQPDGMTMTYGAYDGSQQQYYWGTKRNENYDVAIHLALPALVGKQVTGVIVPIQTLEKITHWRAWMTQELAIVNKVNVPDICSVDFTPQEGQQEVTVMFREPYTITAEGEYVGYS